MWHAPLKVNRLQCVDSDRRLLYATNASRIRSSLSGSQLRLQNSACVGRINSACMCVRVCVCVGMCVRVIVSACMPKTFFTFIYELWEERERETVFPRAHKRILPLRLFIFESREEQEDRLTKRTGTEITLKTTKNFGSEAGCSLVLCSTPRRLQAPFYL